MKVSELTGVRLDWWVARIEFMGGILVTSNYQHCFVRGELYSPSTDWAQGGPIIERECISSTKLLKQDIWYAESTDTHCGHGPTPLIAAMRCFVASKFGEEVPDESVG